MFDVASWRVHMSVAQGLQRPDQGRPLYCSGERAKSEKVENPANHTVGPWITGRARAVNPAHPSAPARLRAGGTEWRRSFGYLSPGDPAHGSKTRQPGHAWVRVRRNRLSCGRDRSRRGGDRSGHRPPEALADGKGMATALKALDLPDLPSRRLRALRPWKSRKPSMVRRAARGISPRAVVKRLLQRAPLASSGVAQTEKGARPSSPDKLAASSCRRRRLRGTPRRANRHGMMTLLPRSKGRMRVRPTNPLLAQTCRVGRQRRCAAQSAPRPAEKYKPPK